MYWVVFHFFNLHCSAARQAMLNFLLGVLKTLIWKSSSIIRLHWQKPRRGGKRSFLMNVEEIWQLTFTRLCRRVGLLLTDQMGHALLVLSLLLNHCVVFHRTNPIQRSTAYALWRIKQHHTLHQVFRVATVALITRAHQEMRYPNVTWRIILYDYSFTTELRHTCTSGIVSK